MSLETLGPLANANAAFAFALGLIAILLTAGALGLHRIIRMRRELRPYLHTFDTASVGMTHLTLDGKWIRVNRKMAEITGYSIEELMQLSYDDISLEEDQPANAEMNARLVSGEIDTYSFEKRYRRKDGQVIWVKTSPSLARRSDGTPDYFITVIEDIDALKRL